MIPQTKNTNTILFAHNIKLSPYPDNIPKSKYYRTEIAHLLGKSIALFGKISSIRKHTIANRCINQILLTDVMVMYKNRYYHIDHMWTSVEKGFLSKNKLKEKINICSSGYLYEYISRGRRNIGFKLDNVRIVPSD